MLPTGNIFSRSSRPHRTRPSACTNSKCTHGHAGDRGVARSRSYPVRYPGEREVVWWDRTRAVNITSQPATRHHGVQPNYKLYSTPTTTRRITIRKDGRMNGRCLQPFQPYHSTHVGHDPRLRLFISSLIMLRKICAPRGRRERTREAGEGIALWTRKGSPHQTSRHGRARAEHGVGATLEVAR